MKKFTQLRKKAQSLVEYSLILALVSVVAITLLQTMGSKIKTTVTTINTQLNQANAFAQYQSANP